MMSMENSDDFHKVTISPDYPHLIALDVEK